MSPTAIALILLSAVAHVFWNYQVKRAAVPAIYTWWLLVLGVLFMAPLALWLTWPVSIPAAGWYCVGGTALFYAGYFWLIALSYDHEEFSRAYPIARGVAPVATLLWGVLFYHETPSLVGYLGIAAISGGVLALGGSALGRDRLPDSVSAGRMTGESSPRPRASLPVAGVLAAIGTGLCTSGYSAIDKEGVKHISPVLYIVLTFAAGALFLGTRLSRRWSWQAFAGEMRRDFGVLCLAAGAQIGGYLLVLEVLRSAPVSYVVPLRSVAVLLSVFTGARWLGEDEGPLRYGAAALIVLGITAIAWGG